ncbi:MAG: hypothetical protein K6G72_05360 [Lachnospiraceae bacterium]|nr:hypothetical protein [Lachnospiraceae bacterium]
MAKKIALSLKIFAKHKKGRIKKNIKSHAAEEIRSWLFALIDIVGIYNSFAGSQNSSSGLGRMLSSMAQRILRWERRFHIPHIPRAQAFRRRWLFL